MSRQRWKKAWDEDGDGEKDFRFFSSRGRPTRSCQTFLEGLEAKEEPRMSRCLFFFLLLRLQTTWCLYTWSLSIVLLVCLRSHSWVSSLSFFRLLSHVSKQERKKTPSFLSFLRSVKKHMSKAQRKTAVTAASAVYTPEKDAPPSVRGDLSSISHLILSHRLL